MKDVLKQWYPILAPEIEKDYFQELTNRVAAVDPEALCPPVDKVFRVYQTIPPDRVKVVILGLDPYIKGEACGLSFSCEIGKVTPSMRVVFNALLKEGFSTTKRTNPDLSDWADQGVFLLNTILTTERGKTLAHESFGWQRFTGATLRHLARSEQPMVFMLWGKHAQTAGASYLNHLRYPKLVLRNCHPMAENYGTMNFSDKGQFKEANDFLVEHNQTPIIWDTNSQPITDS